MKTSVPNRENRLKGSPPSDVINYKLGRMNWHRLLEKEQKGVTALQALENILYKTAAFLFAGVGGAKAGIKFIKDKALIERERDMFSPSPFLSHWII
ncbi:hypothetical protein J14TS5_31780 [Paenibacillus lautus]|uniref:hypothetical protein n=1 Tax=Paenibacillus lautus TaxID=1401 RepID=UPI001B00BD6A|nr:hypothetical protein [Paenibacillus lautus]GIO98092.1 hypothetical protein J14TS5_31780 [Paenibacillus lautus]